ncbi:MAG: polysaccharide biosynthesis/export family protein [Candidatus Methylacidiphilales bacterium]
MKIKNIVLFSVLGLAMLSSCVSNKKYILFQNAKTSSPSDSSKSSYQLDRTIYKLQVNDILYISLVSTDENVTRAFSHGGGQQMMQVQSQLGNMVYLTGYAINSFGEIDLPVLAKVKIIGLTIEEAKKSIETELNKYFKVYHLIIKLNEMPFTVLGEVTRPGRYSGMVNQITITEALGLAGDLSPIANRKNVTLIRQLPEGAKIYKFDITQADIINTPYYFLRPNDVIYVEPLKSRSIGNFSNFQNSLQTITPLLTTLVLALNTYIIITR